MKHLHLVENVLSVLTFIKYYKHIYSYIYLMRHNHHMIYKYQFFIKIGHPILVVATQTSEN